MELQDTFTCLLHNCWELFRISVLRQVLLQTHLIVRVLEANMIPPSEDSCQWYYMMELEDTGLVDYGVLIEEWELLALISHH